MLAYVFLLKLTQGNAEPGNIHVFVPGQGHLWICKLEESMMSHKINVQSVDYSYYDYWL